MSKKHWERIDGAYYRRLKDDKEYRIAKNEQFDRWEIFVAEGNRWRCMGWCQYLKDAKGYAKDMAKWNCERGASDETKMEAA